MSSPCEIVNDPPPDLSRRRRQSASRPPKLELLDGAGTVRAGTASDTPVRPPDTESLNVQAIWQQPAQPPSAAASMHRHALGGGADPAPDACTPSGGAPDAPAAVGRAGRGGRGGGGGGGAPTLQPGQYTVRLTVYGQTYTQPVTIKPDPRGAPNGVNDGAGGGDD